MINFSPFSSRQQRACAHTNDELPEKQHNEIISEETERRHNGNDVVQAVAQMNCFVEDQWLQCKECCSRGEPDDQRYME